ncbi:hypothetical protein ACIA8O_39905 [Kitasatospora sp. NPDC051853]|uniref:hypothetical protein n=1 Tax=Kitasatospora sp. NPDC051853 TaxID=3364058 RepID=UPI0037A5C9AF
MTTTDTSMVEQYEEHVTEAVEPVAVAVISAKPLRVRQQAASDATTGQVPVAQAPVGPVQIIGANPWRQRLVVRVKGGGVYLGPAAELLTSGTGAWLPAGQAIEITSRIAWYAVADPDNTGTATVSFLAEVSDG